MKPFSVQNGTSHNMAMSLESEEATDTNTSISEGQSQQRADLRSLNAVPANMKIKIPENKGVNNKRNLLSSIACRVQFVVLSKKTNDPIIRSILTESFIEAKSRIQSFFLYLKFRLQNTKMPNNLPFDEAHKVWTIFPRVFSKVALNETNDPKEQKIIKGALLKATNPPEFFLQLKDLDWSVTKYNNLIVEAVEVIDTIDIPLPKKKILHRNDDVSNSNEAVGPKALGSLNVEYSVTSQSYQKKIPIDDYEDITFKSKKIAFSSERVQRQSLKVDCLWKGKVFGHISCENYEAFAILLTKGYIFLKGALINRAHFDDAKINLKVFLAEQAFEDSLKEGDNVKKICTLTEKTNCYCCCNVCYSLLTKLTASGKNKTRQTCEACLLRDLTRESCAVLFNMLQVKVTIPTVVPEKFKYFPFDKPEKPKEEAKDIQGDHALNFENSREPMQTEDPSLDELKGPKSGDSEEGDERDTQEKENKQKEDTNFQDNRDWRELGNFNC